MAHRLPGPLRAPDRRNSGISVGPGGPSSLKRCRPAVETVFCFAGSGAFPAKTRLLPPALPQLIARRHARLCCVPAPRARQRRRLRVAGPGACGDVPQQRGGQLRDRRHRALHGVHLRVPAQGRSAGAGPRSAEDGRRRRPDGDAAGDGAVTAHRRAVRATAVRRRVPAAAHRPGCGEGGRLARLPGRRAGRPRRPGRHVRGRRRADPPARCRDARRFTDPAGPALVRGHRRRRPRTACSAT